MVTHLDIGTHFRTYVGERSASFSANCNVLSALLHLEAPFLYATQMISAPSFTCGAWDTGQHEIQMGMIHALLNPIGDTDIIRTD